MSAKSNVKGNARNNRTQEKPAVKLVTPSFTAAGNQPTVKVDGNKTLGESLVIAVMEPGKNTVESVTLHRPIGCTPYSQGENWVGSYTSTLPTLLAEGSNDTQKAEMLLAQKVNELLVEKGMIQILTVNDKKVITYSAKVTNSSIGELGKIFESASPDRALPNSMTTDDFMTCNKSIKAYIDKCVQDKVLPSRNELKRVCDSHIELLYKASPEYTQYREDLDAYNALSVKDKKQKAQPKAPRKRATWINYIPLSMMAAEGVRSSTTDETRSTFVIDSIINGNLSETVDPYSRNKQLPINQFHGLSLAEVKNRLLGALHFGESLSGGPGAEIPIGNETQPDP